MRISGITAIICFFKTRNTSLISRWSAFSGTLPLHRATSPITRSTMACHLAAVTRTIPAGSTVQAFITLPADTRDSRQPWGLESLSVTGDLEPGFSLVLPGLRTLGDFWKQGLTTYTIVVTDPDGAQSLSSTDFGAAGFYRNVDDTSYMVPGINSFREFVNADGDTIVEIKGRFVANTGTDVVFEDIVAPQDSIDVIDDSTIEVNLSRVPNFDLTLMKTYLLTVGQDSWTDIFQFRHTPR